MDEMPVWVCAVARQYHSQHLSGKKKASKECWKHFMDQAVRLIAPRVSNFDKAAFIRFAETLK